MTRTGEGIMHSGTKKRNYGERGGTVSPSDEAIDYINHCSDLSVRCPRTRRMFGWIREGRGIDCEWLGNARVVLWRTRAGRWDGMRRTREIMLVNDSRRGQVGTDRSCTWTAHVYL
jgi:hypothetical protein